MQFALLAATLLTAAPAPPKLAIGALATVKVPPELATFAGEHLAEEFRARGFHVTTAGDMAAVLGLERQKQLLGCAEGSSTCLAELASALGVDAIVGGQLAKLGETYQLDLKVVSASDGTRLAGFSEQLKDESQLTGALKRAAATLGAQLVATAPRGNDPAVTVVAQGTPSDERPLRRKAWIPAVAGGTLLIGGVICSMLGHSDYNVLATGTQIQQSEWDKRRSRGPVLEGVGVAGVVLGSAGLALAGTLFFWPSSSGSTQLAIGPQGVSVSGAFP